MSFTVDFNQAIVSDQPVLVDFWSPNCVHCKMSAPIVEDLAEKYLGQVWVTKVQAETNLQAVVNYKVTGLPTFVIVQDGKEVNRLVGRVRWSELDQFIKNNLNA